MTAPQYDRAECVRLIAEAREDDDRMTPAPWIASADSLYHDSEDDGTIELARFTGDACVDDDSAAARTRNNLAAMADQLEEAGREIRHLNNDVDTHRQCHEATVAERDQLRAEVERMRPVADSANAWRSARCDKGPDCGDGLTYHDYDCPTNETMRGLCDAVDAYRAARDKAGGS